MLPAYGREVLELRSGGRRPAQPGYVVGDWELARALRARDRFALIAEGSAFAYGFLRFRRFDFSMLRDLDVVLMPGSLEWLGAIPPQVQFCRPRSVRRTAIFYAGLQDPEEFVEREMAQFDAEWAQQKAEERARIAADLEKKVRESIERAAAERARRAMA